MNYDHARIQAFTLLDDIIQNKKYANLTLKNSLSGFDQRDKAFICALVYGTLDKLINIDYIISLYTKGKVNSKIKTILRMGLYQILYMDKVPDSAAVSTSVDIAQSIGKGMLKGFINGVLRNISRNKDSIKYPDDKIKYLSYKYSFPEFFVKEMIETIGFDESEKLFSVEENHNTCIRVDQNKADTETIKNKLSGTDSIYFDDCFYLSGMPKMLENGVCSVQSEASMAAVKALSPQENDKILDCCAAPGGKTVYIASLLKKGKVVAFDKHEHRVQLIKNNVARCGYEDIVETATFDMTDKLSGNMFDKVLVDAPCSGMGVVGQKPEIKNTATAEGFSELQKMQKKILQNASEVVKKDGILVYSTCTVRKQENIDIINDFLNNNKNFVLCSLKGLLSEKIDLNHNTENGYIQFYPHKDKTDGFFIARMKRI